MSILNHTPRKRFGQNFLVDPGIIQQIIRSIQPQTQQNMVEIGPGRGALTSLLLQSLTKLCVIELDRDLIPFLKLLPTAQQQLKIIEADALTVNFSELKTGAEKIRVVGNLPYNISTPLIFHLLKFKDDIADMHFMLQKEVVERMAALPGNKDYGRLSIMTQYFCEVEHLFTVPPSAFNPAPKVESAIVRLVPHPVLPFIANNLPTLENIVRTAFNARRKTIQNALKTMIKIEWLEQLNIPLSARPENLFLEDYVKLANFIDAGRT